MIFKAFFHRYFLNLDVSGFRHANTPEELLNIALNGSSAGGVNNEGLRSIHRGLMNAYTFSNMYNNIYGTGFNTIMKNIGKREYKELLNEPFLVVPVVIPKEAVRLTPSCALPDDSDDETS